MCVALLIMFFVLFHQVDEALKEKIKVYALHLMSFWEKDIMEEIEYTGKWRDCSVYTGSAGYALLYLEAGKILNNTDYIEQAFFLVCLKLIKN